MHRLLLTLTIIISSLSMTATDHHASHWKSVGLEGEAFDSMMERAAFLDMPRRDLISIIRRFPENPDASNPRQARARLAYWKAWVLLKENPDSALRLSEYSLSLCDSAGYPYDHARFSLLSADFLKMQGHLADAYFICRGRLATFRRMSDPFWEAKSLVMLGTIMQDLGEYHEAMGYFSEAQRIFGDTQSEACLVKNRINLANISYMLGMKQTAMKWLEGLESNRFVISDSAYLANVLVSRFHISEFADRRAALEAYDISRRLGNDHLLTISLLSMGMLSYEDGNFVEGTGYLKEGLAATWRTNDLPERRRILEGLVKCCLASGDTAASGNYRLLLAELSDSLYHHERIDSMRKTEHLATINRYEENVRKLEEKSHWKFLLTISIGGGIVAVLILSLWLVWTSKKRLQADRLLEEEKRRGLELLNRQYAIEIEAKEKEIASNTMLMSQKNAQLKELSSKIEHMRERGDIAQSNSDSLKSDIDRQLSADDDWRYFKLRFDKVHPNFFTQLQERYPDLSKTELRLCAYIRVGMSAKEIAQILSVKPETVNTSRYRMRKKMRLPSDLPLETAIESIGQTSAAT